MASFYNTSKYLQGMQAEFIFQDLAAKNGWIVTDSTEFEDIYGHFDCTITQPKISYTVDVKSVSKATVGDMPVVWLEIRNKSGNSGWLFGSCQVFAFETLDSFLMIKRQKLQDLVFANCKFDTWAKHSGDALFKMFRLKDSPSILTMIPLEMITQNSYMIWNKL